MILDLSNVKNYFQFVQMIMCLCFVQKKTRFSADDDPKQFEWIQLLVIIFLCIVYIDVFYRGRWFAHQTQTHKHICARLLRNREKKTNWINLSVYLKNSVNNAIIYKYKYKCDSAIVKRHLLEAFWTIT